jgi:hypothetical protein
MTSPPLTCREYAYIHITGPGTHESITETLGLRPTEAWNVGDENPRNGKPRTFMSWRFSSGLDDTAPLSQHLEQLFSAFGLKADTFRSGAN